MSQYDNQIILHAQRDSLLSFSFNVLLRVFRSSLSLALKAALAVGDCEESSAWQLFGFVKVLKGYGRRQCRQSEHSWQLTIDKFISQAQILLENWDFLQKEQEKLNKVGWLDLFQPFMYYVIFLRLLGSFKMSSMIPWQVVNMSFTSGSFSSLMAQNLACSSRFEFLGLRQFSQSIYFPRILFSYRSGSISTFSVCINFLTRLLIYIGIRTQERVGLFSINLINSSSLLNSISSLLSFTIMRTQPFFVFAVNFSSTCFNKSSRFLSVRLIILFSAQSISLTFRQNLFPDKVSFILPSDSTDTELVIPSKVILKSIIIPFINPLVYLQLTYYPSFSCIVLLLHRQGYLHRKSIRRDAVLENIHRVHVISRNSIECLGAVQQH